MKPLYVLMLMVVPQSLLCVACSQSAVVHGSGAEALPPKMLVQQEPGTASDAVSAMRIVLPVDPSHFIDESLVEPIVQEKRELADGTTVLCYIIKTRSVPHEHAMGPWAPTRITDGPDEGGIWFKDGRVYDVDGPFIVGLAKLYDDPAWKLYNDDGTIRVTDTIEAFEAAARPDVAPEYNNYVVEGRAEWVGEIVSTYIIPVTPIYRDQPVSIAGGRGGAHPGDGPEGRPGRGGPRGERPGPPPGQGDRLDGPPNRAAREAGGRGRAGATALGVAFNGVRFDPPAPLHAILAAHTIAPFDDAGGHINPHAGYHYHAATGKTKQISQPDGHAPMIGYALDGFAIYAHRDEDGNPSADLDECGGHYDDTRGYHYHAGAPADNQILKAFRGTPGSISTE